MAPLHKESRSMTQPNFQYCTVTGHILNITIFVQTEVPSQPTSHAPLLAETEQQMLQDLMSEAMEETDGQQAPGPQQNGTGFAQEF